MSPSVPYSVSLNSVPTRHTERAGTYSERSPDAQPSKESSKTPSSGGLAGVVAGESSICTVALGSGGPALFTCLGFLPLLRMALRPLVNTRKL